MKKQKIDNILINLTKEEQVYLVMKRNDLTLDSIAKSLNISESYLSLVLSRNKNKATLKVKKIKDYFKKYGVEL